MGSNNRKRAIRKLMAETGLKYMAAGREIERRKAETGGVAPTVTASPAQEIAASLAAHMGFTTSTVILERTPEEICCGDPTNLDGNAHPWSEVGEDDRGIHYRCPVCGAKDVD